MAFSWQRESGATSQEVARVGHRRAHRLAVQTVPKVMHDPAGERSMNPHKKRI
jgi:hypothetical protein